MSRRNAIKIPPQGTVLVTGEEPVPYEPKSHVRAHVTKCLNRECSVGHEADFADKTEDMVVQLRLPLEVDMEQDRRREDIRPGGAVSIRAPERGQT